MLTTNQLGVWNYIWPKAQPLDRNIELRWPAVYKKTFGPLVFLTLAVLLLDAVVEYRTVGGFSPIAIKDFITVALCAIPYALFRFAVRQKKCNRGGRRLWRWD